MNPNHGDTTRKDGHVKMNDDADEENDNMVCSRKRSVDSSPGEGLLKKLKQAYDTNLKERLLATPDMERIEALPTVSDEEIALSDLTFLASSGKVPVSLQASSILDLGDDHSTVVDETWHLEDLFGPSEGISDTAADSPTENLFGISNDLFHFGLETDYPPPRNEKGEIVHFASVREALQSMGSQQDETSTMRSTSEGTEGCTSSIQPAVLPPEEQPRSGGENTRLAASSFPQPLLLQDHQSRSSPAMMSASSLRSPALPRSHSPRQFRDDCSVRAMLPPPPVPVIAIQPRRQYGLPHSVPSNNGDDWEQRSVHVRPSQRPLHHPLSVPSMPYPGLHPSSTRNNEVLPMPMPLVQTCDEPAVLTLTSFPFRIICVNKAFSDLTRRSHELIGSSFYELFVSESDYTPSMATTPTLLGLFNNDIVRVITKIETSSRGAHSRPSGQQRPTSNHLDSWVESYDSDGSSSIGSIGVEDELASLSDTFCTIRVDGIPHDGTSMQYFSIKLSPLQIPAPSNHLALSANNNNHNRHSFSSSSVIYLPMPCGGTGNGLPPLRPRQNVK